MLRLLGATMVTLILVWLKTAIARPIILSALLILLALITTVIPVVRKSTIIRIVAWPPLGPCLSCVHWGILFIVFFLVITVVIVAISVFYWSEALLIASSVIIPKSCRLVESVLIPLSIIVWLELSHRNCRSIKQVVFALFQCVPARVADWAICPLLESENVNAETRAASMLRRSPS